MPIVINGGFETGDFTNWIVTESTVGTVAISTANPRTGTYHTRFTTISASIRWGRIIQNISDEAVLARLRGKTIHLIVYCYSITSFAGGPGSYTTISISDSEGNSDTITISPYVGQWYTEIATITVDAAATSVSIQVYWYKSGGGTIKRVDIDDVTILVSPGVTTNAASSVTGTTATLNGTLDDDGDEACDCSFEYGLDTGYGTTTLPQSKNTGESFEQAITGLTPNTTYHYRAIATNSVGTSNGADRTFTTPDTPTVTTDPATSVGATIATLNGTLDDDGREASDCGFEYGETIGYGTTTATQSKETDDTFEQEVRGLRSGGTVYHFRAIATNSAGTSYGVDRTLHTEALSAEAHQALGKGYALGRHGL